MYIALWCAQSINICFRVPITNFSYPIKLRYNHWFYTFIMWKYIKNENSKFKWNKKLQDNLYSARLLGTQQSCNRKEISMIKDLATWKYSNAKISPPGNLFLQLFDQVEILSRGNLIIRIFSFKEISLPEY